MPLAADAQQRLDALRRFLVVDAPEEDELARLVRVAATVYGVSYAVLSLRDAIGEPGEGEGQERVAAAYGTDTDEFGADAKLIESGGEPALPLTIADASEDKRFAKNPLVSAGKAKFYAGVPLKSAHGFTIGTLAVLDPEPQELNGEGLSLLVDIGALVEPVMNQREFQRERNAAVAVRDAAALEQTAAGTARDAALAERDAALAQRDAARAERDAADAEREAVATERDAIATERDALKTQRDSVIAERDAATKAAEAAVAERDRIAADIVAARAERDAALTERDAMAAEKTAALAERESARGEVEAASRARDAAVSERDAARAERDATLAERGTEADDLRAAIAERDEARTEREAAAAELDTARRELAALKVELDNALVGNDAAIRARDVASAQIDALAAARDAAAAERDAALAERDAALAGRDSGAGKWSELLNAAPAPLLVADPDGAVLYANARARLLLGLGDDVTSASIARLVSYDHAPRLAALLADPATRPTEIDITDATGAIRPVRMSAAPAPTAGEGAVLLSIRTLEAERRLAEALRDREAALANAGAAASQEPDEFIVSVSEEVSASLAALAEYAQLQQAQSADPDMREMAAAFGSVAMRLLRVLEGTFGLAGMDARSPALVPLDLGPAVETAAELYRGPAEARDLAYVVDAPDDFACAWADPQALAQIMDALLSNAVANTARGGIRVRVAADDQRVFVEVQDTGVGVDAATLESALEGSEGGVARPGGGLGLGLALARRLADRMGAELTGRSVPGQGSVFRLALRPAPHVAEAPGGDGALRTETSTATA